MFINELFHALELGLFVKPILIFSSAFVIIFMRILFIDGVMIAIFTVFRYNSQNQIENL